jgi:hypothetical protein
MTGRGERTFAFPAVTAVLLIAAVAYQIVFSGAWLDEFWQYWISGAPTVETLFDRLAGDPHPPFFNLMARAIVEIVGQKVIFARLVSTALALLTFTAGLVALARSEPNGSNTSVYVLFWLLIVGMAGPVGLLELAPSFRSYPWVIALASLQAALLFRVAGRQAISFPAFAAGIVTYFAIVLHYVGAIPAIAIAIVSTCAAWQSDSVRHAKAFGVATILAILTLSATALWQKSHWSQTMDFNWIENGGVSGISQLLNTFWQYVTFNPLTIALILLGLSRGAFDRRSVIVFAPIPIAIVALLIADALTPVLNGRYIVSILILLALAAAMSFRQLSPSRFLWPALTAVVVAQAGLHVWLRPPISGWDAAARQIAGIVRVCPQTQVFSASHWLFSDGSDSGTARRESQVVRFGHEMMGRRYGYNPVFLSGKARVVAPDGRCPTLLVIEHAGGLAQIGTHSILRRAGLTLPPAAQVRMFDLRNGVLIRIDARN